MSTDTSGSENICDRRSDKQSFNLEMGERAEVQVALGICARPVATGGNPRSKPADGKLQLPQPDIPKRDRVTVVL